MFRVFSTVSVFRGVPGCSEVFRGVPGCSGVFRCSGVPVFRCSGVPGFSTLPCSKIFHKTTVPKNDPNVCLVYSFVLYQRNLKTSTLLEQTVLKFNQKNSEILLVLQGKD